MFVLDALLVILAFLCAGPMLYGIWAGRQRAAGVDVPTTGEALRAIWAAVAPPLAVAGWLARKALAPARDHGPPPWGVSSVSADAYDERDDAEGADFARDLGLSARLSALSPARRDALLAIIVDTPDKGERAALTSRAALVAALVAAGWQTGEIRAQLKGDNGAIGLEVEAARQRLGVGPSVRFVTINGGRDGKVAI